MKINIPEGYEVNKENSTFEEIVFKKVEDPFSKLPKSWKEYCEHTKNSPSYYWNSREPHVKTSIFTGFYNEFSTKERAEQYVALGKLIQLRDYWTNNWECDGDSFIVYTARFEPTSIKVGRSLSTNYPLAFPTVTPLDGKS